MNIQKVCILFFSVQKKVQPRFTVYSLCVRAVPNCILINWSKNQQKLRNLVWEGSKLARSHLSILVKEWNQHFSFQFQIKTSIKQLINRHTHIEATESVERPVLKIDLFFHISHQFSANGENTALENRTNKNKDKGKLVHCGATQEGCKWADKFYRNASNCPTLPGKGPNLSPQSWSVSCSPQGWAQDLGSQTEDTLLPEKASKQTRYFHFQSFTF